MDLPLKLQELQKRFVMSLPSWKLKAVDSKGIRDVEWDLEIPTPSIVQSELPVAQAGLEAM